MLHVTWARFMVEFGCCVRLCVTCKIWVGGGMVLFCDVTDLECAVDLGVITTLF